MNILITAPSLEVNKNVSGISSVAKAIITAGENGSKLRFIHFSIGREDGEKINFKWLWKQFIIPLRLVTVLLKKNIQCVHINLPLNKMGIIRDSIVFLISFIAGKKILVHVHGGEYLMTAPRNKLINNLIAVLFKKADAVIVLSETERNIIQQRYAITQKLFVVPNAVDITALQCQKVFDVPVLNLLFLGRIHESKGIQDIAKALQLIAKSRQRFKFILCGTGPLEKEIIHFLQPLLGESFEYRGVVKGQEKIDIIKSAHIFLLPSRYGEGLPVALLESMAAGVIPVVTDDASIKNVVQDTVNGFIVPKEDPVFLSSLLHDLFYSAKLAGVSNNAESSIERGYNLSAFHAAITNIYLGLDTPVSPASLNRHSKPLRY